VSARWAATMLLLSMPCVAAESVPAEYGKVEPSYEIQFPRDEGSHPSFRTEWWYVTGWLEDQEGDPLGFQVTFFRNRPGSDEANPSKFALRQVLFAHAAISDPKLGLLLRDEKSARAGFGLAEAAEHALDVHIDDWSLHSENNGYRAVISAKEFAMQLDIASTQRPMLQGERGFSRKGPDPESASHYYSIPALKVSGTMKVRGRAETVRGIAWLDHEWSSSYLQQGAHGWDWAGLNLDDGTAIMAFRMRGANGTALWTSASVRTAHSAAVQTLGPQQVQWRALRVWRSPRTRVEYPIEWEVTLDARHIFLRPLMDDQENDARASTGSLYWEGAVRAADEAGRFIGRGYLELTGYGERLKMQ
jgi:predicted secreted hydrolase